MNSTKRNVDLTSAILGIIIGSLEAIGALVVLISSAVLCSGYDFTSLGAILFMVALLDIAFCLSFILIGAKLCKKPKVIDGVVVSRKGLDVALLVLSAVYILFSIICFAVGNAGAIVVINLILSLVTLALKIVSLNLKETKVPQEKNENIIESNKDSIDAKIAELKHLKELGVITDEQYNIAVEKIINNLTK